MVDVVYRREFTRRDKTPHLLAAPTPPWLGLFLYDGPLRMAYFSWVLFLATC